MRKIYIIKEMWQYIDTSSGEPEVILRGRIIGIVSTLQFANNFVNNRIIDNDLYDYIVLESELANISNNNVTADGKIVKIYTSDHHDNCFGRYPELEQYSHTFIMGNIEKLYR